MAFLDHLFGSVDSGLHGQEGDFQIKRYTASNPLFHHAPIQVAADTRHFEHAVLLAGRHVVDGIVQAADLAERVSDADQGSDEKSFLLIQIVAGLYPDMPAFDARGTPEAGFPWENDYHRINPAYFGMADRRIQRLVESGQGWRRALRAAGVAFCRGWTLKK